MLRFFEKQKPLCLAHRGASSLAPENTLAAGKMAAHHRAHGWEVDVCLSADLVPVLLHDDTLRRTTDVALRSEFADRKPWRVGDFTWRELQTLDAGSWFHVQDPFAQVAAGTAVSAEVCAAQRIPSLRQAVELSQRLGLGLNIELKPEDPETPLRMAHELPGRAAAVIRELQAQELCLFSSFDPGLLELARDCAPEIPRALLLNKRPSSLEALEIVLCDLHACGLHPKLGLLRNAELGRFVHEGYLVTVWVANSLREMQKLAEAGASGLITDCPQLGPQLWRMLAAPS